MQETQDKRGCPDKARAMPWNVEQTYIKAAHVASGTYLFEFMVSREFKLGNPNTWKSQYLEILSPDLKWNETKLL